MVFIMVREIVKAIMFIVLWSIPILLSHINQNNSYLWFFAMSAILTGFLFLHYEDLEKIDQSNNCTKRRCDE